jgi:hypothetical protein
MPASRGFVLLPLALFAACATSRIEQVEMAPIAVPDAADATGGERTSPFPPRHIFCPRPRNPGLGGTVAFALTFTPRGDVVSTRLLTPQAPARVIRAGKSVLSRCMADPLPPEATQINQEGTVTFAFAPR